MAGIAEKLYYQSPIWIQRILIPIYGLWWYRKRFGGKYSRLLDEFRSRDSWTAEQFHSFQEGKLSELFKAAKNSIYYDRVCGGLLAECAENPFLILAKLPILSKEKFRLFGNEMISTEKVPRGTLVFKSSGTTGTPTDVYYPREFHNLEMAVATARSLDWAGVPDRAARVMFGSRKVCRFDQKKPPFWRISPAENLAYASIYHLSEENLPHYLRFLRLYQPMVVMGYPSALYTIAQYAVENADYPAAASAIITTSETLMPEARAVIEKAWACKVYDRYGSVEGCAFVSQCEFGSYHVSPEIGYVEILDEHDEPVLPGAVGQVVCTGLQNVLQPLIRYRTGDCASWSLSQSCSCGRNMPIMERIEGRYEDTCITRDGRKILRFDTVFKGIHHIKEAQVIQEDIDRFIIRVIKTDGYCHEDENGIRRNMGFHVGKAKVEIEVVDRIPRTNSGKFRAVLCNLRPENRQE